MVRIDIIEARPCEGVDAPCECVCNVKLLIPMRAGGNNVMVQHSRYLLL